MEGKIIDYTNWISSMLNTSVKAKNVVENNIYAIQSWNREYKMH